MSKFYICHKTSEDKPYKICKGKTPIVFNTKEEAETKLQEFVKQTKTNPEYVGHSHFWDRLFVVEE